MAKVNVISYVGTVSELKENLEQLGIMFPNQTLKAVYEVTGLLKDSSIEDEPFIQAPAVRAKSAHHIYDNECLLCGSVFKKNVIEENFVCPDCRESMMNNLSATTIMDFVHDKAYYMGFTELSKEEKAERDAFLADVEKFIKEHKDYMDKL